MAVRSNCRRSRLAASATAAALWLITSGRRAADRLRPEVVQLAQRGGVERAGLDALDAEAAQPGAHLARGAGREGQREHALRLLRAGVDGIRDAVGDGARLAGAGAGEDAQRARRRERDLALLGVETGQDVVGRGHVRSGATHPSTSRQHVGGVVVHVVLVVPAAGARSRGGAGRSGIGGTCATIGSCGMEVSRWFMTLTRERRLSSDSTTYHGAQAVLVCGHHDVLGLGVVLPAGDRLEVHRRELPLAHRVLGARAEPALLLDVGDAEPVLAQR